MQTYLSARRTATVYDGVTPSVIEFRDATAWVSLTIFAMYAFPARLIFPPLTTLGRPGVMVGLLLFVWWALSRFHPNLVTRGQQPMRWAFAVYLVTLATSYVAGQARGLDVLEANSADRTVLMALAAGGVLLAACDGVLTRERIDTALRWLCYGCTVMALFALSQFVLNRDFTTYLKLPPILQFQRDLVGFDERGGGGMVRVAGTAGHYIEFSVLMVVGLVVAIHYARFAATRRERQIFAGIAMLLAGVIPISLSRTGVLALGAAIVLLICVWPLRTTFNVLVIGVFLAAIIQVGKPGLLATLKALLFAGESDPSIQGRLEDYDYVAPFIKERFWFGRGVGTWLPELYQLLDNQWLVTLVSTGIVGVAGLAALFLTGVFVAARVRRFAKTDSDRDLAAVLAVAIGVMAVTAFTFDALYFTTYLFTMHLLIGLTGAMWRVTRAQRLN